MINSYYLYALTLIWAMSGAATTASASVIVNGGLELEGNDSFVTVLAGNSYASWLSAGTGDVEFISQANGTGPAFEGEGFVDLNGVGFTGSIQQTLTTTPGVEYNIGFALSGNPGVVGELLTAKTMDVLWNGAVVGSFTFNHLQGDTQQTLRFEPHEVVVTALGNDVIRFLSTTTTLGNAGPILDAITAAQTPEPAAAAMMVMGIAAIASRRRP